MNLLAKDAQIIDIYLKQAFNCLRFFADPNLHNQEKAKYLYVELD